MSSVFTPYVLVWHAGDSYTDTHFSLERQKVILTDRKKMLGLFLNELALSQDVAPDPLCFRSIIDRVTILVSRVEEKLAAVETDLRHLLLAHVPPVPPRAVPLTEAAVTRSIAARMARFNALMDENAALRRRSLGVEPAEARGAAEMIYEDPEQL